MDTYVLFNTFEGFFWIMGGVFTGIFYFFISIKFHRFILFLSATLIFFGISDFVEIRMNGFLYPIVWWLVWKVMGVIGLIVSLVWYIKLRLNRNIV